MEKHRALIVGAGRIGAGYNWSDEGYTHAGAVRALADRVELVGFVERDAERRRLAFARWEAPTYDSIQQAIKEHDPDIVSVCTQPEQQEAVVSEIIENHIHVNGLWVEKPWVSGYRASPPLIQVNYMRRADERHRELAERPTNSRVLIVYGKDDVHTKCHFEDLAEWWDCKLDYRVFNGPCSYALAACKASTEIEWFDNGGVDGGECFKGMLSNLLDAVEGKAELWSPQY